MRALDLAKAAMHEYREFGPRFVIESVRSKFLKKEGSATIDAGRYGKLTIRRSQDDLAVIRMVLGHREYDVGSVRHADENLSQRYKDILALGKKPIIVDAGANIGAATIWFKTRFPEAAVVAIEPEQGNVEILRKNTARFADVFVLDGAIGAVPGFVTLDESTSSVAGQTERAESGITVYTVRDAVNMVKDGELFIAKIDIEGFERDLFASDIEWIDEAFAVMIEPHDWMLPGQRSSHSFQSALAGKGFDLFIKGENLLYIRSS